MTRTFTMVTSQGIAKKRDCLVIWEATLPIPWFTSQRMRAYTLFINLANVTRYIAHFFPGASLYTIWLSKLLYHSNQVPGGSLASFANLSAHTIDHDYLPLSLSLSFSLFRFATVPKSSV